jgi:hypothetical protein
MKKLRCLNLINIGLVILAISATFFGGMVLAFDKSLWPLDGQVLYVGHISHILVIPSSALALIKGYMATPRLHAVWLVTQGTIFILALTSSILMRQGMFVYGWWPS